jgi:hypothetical protein
LRGVRFRAILDRVEQASRAGAVAGLGFAAALAFGCGGGGPATAGKSPCELLCEKWNSCRGANSDALPCASLCVYGGNFGPGIGPSPYCPALAAQTTCVAAAVQMSCTAYESGLATCPACPPLTGGPCQTNLDCERYDPRFRCDLTVPGGSCTAPCSSAFDCSEAGPEVCSGARLPSVDPAGTISPTWCRLGCVSDAICRTAEGYACVNGLCDVPQ